MMWRWKTESLTENENIFPKDSDTTELYMM